MIKFIQIVKWDMKERHKILKIKDIILNLIFPQVCGICGKLSTKPVCPKCNLKIKKQKESEILNAPELNQNNIKNYKDEKNKEKLESIKENEKYFEELMYLFKYEGQIRKLILDYKFNEKSYMYKSIASFFINDKKIFENIKKYDKIIPVPISKKRNMQRGYNQSFLIAKELAKQANIELIDNCLIKNKNIIEQSKLNKENRIQNVKGVYTLKNSEKIQNKKILIFDDIYTTGSTANECAKTLMQAKPKKIGILIIAKD